jgi:hypothetical protein
MSSRQKFRIPDRMVALNSFGQFLHGNWIRSFQAKEDQAIESHPIFRPDENFYRQDCTSKFDIRYSIFCGSLLLNSLDKRFLEQVSNGMPVPAIQP